MKIAFFAGTFDPPTLGHQEIIERAALVCTKLYIAVAKSEGKHILFLSQEERISFLKTLTKGISHVEVIPFEGLVVDCAKKLKANFLVRGLRNSRDLEFEMQMASANRQMTGIETLCLLSSSEYSHISSTLIREIASYGRRLDGFVPQEIENSVFQSLSKKLSLGKTT